MKGAIHSAPDLRRVTVIGKADFERITNQLNKRKIEEEKHQAARQEKQRLRDLSRDKVKNWTNTIAVRKCTMESHDLP